MTREGTQRGWAGEPWSDADRAFRTDPRWLGGDDAYTVALPDGRVLWLFGDSFIAEPGQDRRGAAVVHSSVALQDGLDPATATWSFGWRTDAAGRPASLVDAADDTWLWPLDAVLVGGRLLLFSMHVRSTRPDLPDMTAAWRAEGSLGFFEVFGWQAHIVDDPLVPVAQWEPRPVALPATDHGAVLGTAAVVVGEHLLGYGYTPSGALLCRWPLAAAAAGDLTVPQWWDGDSWATDPAEPAVVLPETRTEFTVHWDDELGAWVHVEVTGLVEPDAAVSVRTAPRPEGPWSSPVRAASVTGPPGAFLYAGKAHPELTGADLVVSYVSIAPTCDATLDDQDLYRPRFVRVTRPGRSHHAAAELLSTPGAPERPDEREHR